MIEIKIPTVGESISEVTIAQWLKKEGDYVAMDEVICELESDKATFELNAESAGILHPKASEGDTLEIGALLCEIDETQAKVDEEKEVIKESPSPNTNSSTGEILEMKVPAVGESITEVTISNWLKNDGDIVELDEPIAEIESDKATFELTAEANGKLSVVAQEGETLEIGALICKLEVIETDSSSTTPSTPIQSSTSQSETNYASGHPSPAAAKILAEKGISASEVQGSGIGGRISKEDALSARKAEKLVVKEESQPQATFGPNREQRRQKMSALRKTVARRLVSVKNETAMLTTFNEVDMKPVMDLRKKYKDAFKEKYEVGLGFMSYSRNQGYMIC